MALVDIYFPFDSGPGAASYEDRWSLLFRHLRSNGVLNVSNKLAVSPSSGMVLSVATGAAYIQGMYGGITVAKTVTIAANASGNPRIDYVIMKVDFVANTVEVTSKAGTPAATPAAPTLQQDTGVWEIALAEVAVANGASSLTADNITDRRALYPEWFQTQPNPVRNASFAVWQRGTSITVGAAIVFSADGWRAFRSGSVAGMTVSRQLAADTQGSAYCARIQRDNANSSVASLYLQQSIPTVDSLRFQGRQVTISWRARKGALYSAASSLFYMQAYTGTGTDESLSAGFTGVATLTSSGVAVSTTWQTFSVTVTVPATATQIGLQPVWTPVGTAGATDYVEIKDIRIDEGAVPLPHTPLPFAADLAECQRFFWRCGGVSSSDNITNAQVTGATTAVGWIRHPVQMRANATLTVSGPTTFSVNDVTVAPATTAVALDGGTAQTVHGASVIFTAGGGGLTVGRVARVYANAGYLDFSAEI